MVGTRYKWQKGRACMYIVLTMWEHVGVRGRGKYSVVYEVWMVLVKCVKLDGVHCARSWFFFSSCH